MNISDLSQIKRKLIDDIEREGEKPQDEFREGVGTGLTMALMFIDRLMENEDERMSREYDEE